MMTYKERIMTNEYLNKITLGDAYELIQKLDDKSVDCIYTDIPYLYEHFGCGKAFGQKKKNQKKELQNFIGGIDYKILDEYMRVMKNVNIFIWCSKNQIADILNYFIAKECYYEILVWCKTNSLPMTNQTWLSNLEYCLYFRGKGVRLNDGYELKSKWYESPTNTNDKDKFEHPTIKPLELVERHIKHTTNENDIVLDTFMGSGTTAVACKNTNRQFIGFEIDEKWCKIANDRINGVDAYGQQSFILW